MAISDNIMANMLLTVIYLFIIVYIITGIISKIADIIEQRRDRKNINNIKKERKNWK